MDKSPEEEDGQPQVSINFVPIRNTLLILQYEWNSEGEKPIPEEEKLDEDDVESSFKDIFPNSTPVKSS